MPRRTGRLAASAGMFIGAVLVIAGCGGGSSAGTASPSSATTSSAAGGATGTTVTATEKEFSISLSQTTFKPGAYTFKVTNQGKFPHNLTIEGPGVDKTATTTMQGGQSGEVTVTLQAGSYELWCSVDSHKDKGMDMKITVA
jgi:uncharacterized cupredoxin-like copper-binding protein